MHQPAVESVHSSTLQKQTFFWPVFGLIIAVNATLFAIFGIPAIAENVAWHHAMQHVIIFVSGAGAGASIIFMRKERKES